MSTMAMADSICCLSSWADTCSGDLVTLSFMKNRMSVCILSELSMIQSRVTMALYVHMSGTYGSSLCKIQVTD